MDRRMIGVIGLGLMGQSIAIACASAGYRVILSDSAEGRVFDFISRHPEFEDALVEAKSLADFASCSIVVEAVVEQLQVKLDLLRALETAAPSTTLASNSSTFMPSELAVGLVDRSRLLVCHFFNPADTVPLVEIVPSPDSDPIRIAQVEHFTRSIGKHPVLLRHEVEGFVANRLQAAVLRECYALVERGISTPETVDEVVRLSLAPRWAANGPIATADLGGLDIFVALCDRLFPRLDRSTQAQQLLRRKVHDGRLGAKSGAGLYDWPEEHREAAVRRLTEFFRFGAERERGALRLHAIAEEAR